MQGRPNENTALLPKHAPLPAHRYTAVHHAIHGAINSSQDDQAQNEDPINTNTFLGRFKSHFKNHRVPLNVFKACINSLSLYLAINSQLEGYPDTYEDNLNNLNIGFLIYVAFVFAESMIENNLNPEKSPTASFYFLIAGAFFYMLNFTASNMEAFQADILAGEAQVTDPSGGDNSVSNKTFFEYDFAIPLIIGFSIALKQFILDIHEAAVESKRDFTTKLVDKIPPLPKKILHGANVATEVLVNGGAVFGSGISDLTSLILNFSGVNLLKERQYITTFLYSASFLVGMSISIASHAKLLPISTKTLNDIYVSSFVAVGVSTFYRDNYVNLRYYDDINFSALMAMITFPALLATAVLIYTAHYQCRAKAQASENLRDVDVEQPAMNENDPLIEPFKDNSEDELVHLPASPAIDMQAELEAAMPASTPIIAPASNVVRLFGRSGSFSARGSEKTIVQTHHRANSESALNSDIIVTDTTLLSKSLN